MTELVFDTGALIGLERDRGLLRQVLEVASTDHVRLVVSAAACTEFLGSAAPRRRPATDWLISHFAIAEVDEVLARRAATLARSAKDAAPQVAPGPIDALTVTEAERRDAQVVISGDREDFFALSAASGSVTVVELSDLAR